MMTEQEMNRKEAETLFIASVAAAELRQILGVEVNAQQFLAACRAADEKLADSLGPIPKLDDDQLVKVLCDIAYENGWILTYKLDPIKEGDA